MNNEPESSPFGPSEHVIGLRLSQSLSPSYCSKTRRAALHDLFTQALTNVSYNNLNSGAIHLARVWLSSFAKTRGGHHKYRELLKAKTESLNLGLADVVAALEHIQSDPKPQHRALAIRFLTALTEPGTGICDWPSMPSTLYH